MSDMVKEYFESSFERAQSNECHAPTDIPSPTGTGEPQNQLSDPSMYTLANDQSQMSRDVDLWLQGNNVTTGIQMSRVPLSLRTISTGVSSRFNTNGTWYILALLMPFFSINNYPQWRCHPSTIVNTAEVLYANAGRACERIRCNIRRLAQSQMSRELIATVMDVLLVLYAIGFLILSMYQATIIG